MSGHKEIWIIGPKGGTNLTTLFFYIMNLFLMKMLTVEHLLIR